MYDAEFPSIDASAIWFDLQPRVSWHDCEADRVKAAWEAGVAAPRNRWWLWRQQWRWRWQLWLRRSDWSSSKRRCERIQLRCGIGLYKLGCRRRDKVSSVMSIWLLCCVEELSSREIEVCRDPQIGDRYQAGASILSNGGQRDFLDKRQVFVLKLVLSLCREHLWVCFYLHPANHWRGSPLDEHWLFWAVGQSTLKVWSPRETSYRLYEKPQYSYVLTRSCQERGRLQLNPVQKLVSCSVT